MADLSNEVRQAIEKYGDHPTGATVRDLMDAIGAALALAREEGRRAGIEEAARLVSESGPLTLQRKDLERRIRALASPPPPGAGDTTGNDGKRE